MRHTAASIVWALRSRCRYALRLPRGNAETSSFDPRTYWEARLERHPGLDGVGHIELGPRFNRWAYRARRRAFMSTVRPVLDLRPAGPVLDVGSGTGFYVACWRELGADPVVASDLTGAAGARLRARYPDLEVLRLDITAALERTLLGRFAAVSALDVLFHIVDDRSYRRALENLFALLAPGGLLVFSEDFPRLGRRTLRHCVSRSEGEIEREVRAVGFEPVGRRPMLVLMNTPVDAPAGVRTALWGAMVRAVRGRPRLGGAVGAALYPMEFVLGALARRGPSTKIAVYRRPER